MIFFFSFSVGHISISRYMASSAWILCVWLVCLCLLAARLPVAVAKRGAGAQQHQQQQHGGDKLAQIRDLAASSKGHVLALDDSTYNHFATSKPRGYTLFVFLTASNPKYKCTICKVLEREFELLAESYVAGVKAAKGEETVFFIKLDYEHSSRVFQQYQVMSVPLIFHLSPFHGEGGEGNKEYDIAQRDRLHISQQDTDAEFIANFVRERCGVSVTVQRSKFWTYVALLVVFGVLAALVKPVIDSLPFWLGLVRMKWLWIVVSLGVYVCAISGLIFDIIRSPPWYHVAKDHITFFYPNSGEQFVVEGFIIGFLNLLCSGSLVFIAIAAPKFKSESNRSSAIIGGMLVFLWAFLQIRGYYRMKNSWYGRTF
jgi:oligosaccharyltransferase complex subunit gamma